MDLFSEPELAESIRPDSGSAHIPEPSAATKPLPTRKATGAPVETNPAPITKPKSRNLVVCIDGTSNQFSDKNTNVIELYSHIIKKDDLQLTYYNSGIGTYAKPSWRSYTYMKQVLDNVVDLAIAWNLEKVIIGAYRWLADTYLPGDQIYLFGFSRGAYQVRAVAGMIHNIGLLRPGNQEQIPFAWELYANCDPERNKSYQSKIDTFKKAFSREDVTVRFLGAWDTVSSVGIVREKLLPSIKTCEHVKYFRHALALDERRVKFLPEHVKAPPLDSDRVKEVWFAGTHSDIGGGNKENPDLDRGAEPLIWMMEEAKRAGLNLEPHNVQVEIKGAEITESLEWLWWALEWLPLSRTSYRSGGQDVPKRKPHRGRGRKVITGHKIHFTVLANYQRDTIGKSSRKYKPKANYVEDNGKKRPWNEIFEAVGDKALDGSLWEGNKDVLEALHQIKPLDNEPNGGEWIGNLQKYTLESSKSDLIWRYGGQTFIQKLADYDKADTTQIKQIVKSVLGLKSDSKTQAQLAKQVPSTQAAAEEARTKISDNADSDRIKTTVIPRLESLLQLWDQSQSTHDVELQKHGVVSGFLKKLKTKIQGAIKIPPALTSSKQQENLPKKTSNKLASIIVEIVLEIRALNDDYMNTIYGDSQVFEMFPLLFPQEITDDPTSEWVYESPQLSPYSIPINRQALTRDIVVAIAELAKHELARSALYYGDAMEKLIFLLKQQNLDPKLVAGVLRAMKAMAESYDAASKIIEGQGVPIIVGFISDNNESLAKEAIRVVAVLARQGFGATGLTEANVAPKLLDLLKTSKRSVLEEVVAAIDVIGQCDRPFFSANGPEIARPLVNLVKTIPNASKAIASFTDDDVFRTAFLREKLVEQINFGLQKEEMKSIQEIIRLVLKLAQHDDSRAELAKHSVALELVPLLKSKTSAVAQEASSTMEKLTRLPELLNQELIQRLVPLAKDIQSPRMKMAVIRAAAQNSQNYQTARDLAPGLFELMKDEDKELSEEDGELAAAARDLAMKVVTLDNQSEATTVGSIKLLAKLLKLACKEGPYSWGSDGPITKMSDFTCHAFDVVGSLSRQVEPRKALIAEGVFETVAKLLDSPVSYSVDYGARELVDGLESDGEIQAEIRKHIPRPDSPSSDNDDSDDSDDNDESDESETEEANPDPIPKPEPEPASEFTSHVEPEGSTEPHNA